LTILLSLGYNITMPCIRAGGIMSKKENYNGRSKTIQGFEI